MKLTMQSNAGFTLVELIVVIAILAILAGVAVPAYSGYIQRANDTAVESELAILVTAARSAATLQGVGLEKITVTAEGAVTAYTALTYGPGGLTVTAYAPMELLGLHEGVIHGIDRHGQYWGGCTWSAESGGWACEVEDIPLE